LLARGDGAATATFDIGVLPIVATVATARMPAVLHAFAAQRPRAIVRFSKRSNAVLSKQSAAGRAMQCAVWRANAVGAAVSGAGTGASASVRKSGRSSKSR